MNERHVYKPPKWVDDTAPIVANEIRTTVFDEINARPFTITNCPNCGAPNNGAGRCEYCGTVFATKKNDNAYDVKGGIGNKTLATIIGTDFSSEADRTCIRRFNKEKGIWEWKQK